MEKSLILTVLCIGIALLHVGHGFPIEISSVSTGESSTIWSANYLLPGIAFTLILIGIVLGCVCCRNNQGFKEFSNSSGSLAVPSEGFVNPTLNSELTIFPPLGSNSSEICRFEPLPDIRLPAGNLRPAAFSYAEQEISSQDWFFEPYSNFPRNQLKYVQEYGRGWFGRVVEGEAQNIVPHEKVTKAMVKILHEDATPTDQMYFLHEVKFYRDLKHPNILRLLGRCLETEPFLIILECYPNGDLKTFLSQNLASARALVEQGVTLQMCSNITSGLQFMHQNKFIHTDLAARNCLVAPDLTVKIGDYGNSIEIFNSDYYCAGSVALPVRWCAPETLKCTDITIETREVTQPANIWSLGVVIWEICEFCKLPYAELNDDQVIVRVLGEKNYFLEKPKMMCLYKDELYHLMKLCWNQPLQRPTASEILVILNNLISSNKVTYKGTQSDSKRLTQNFEQRWQNSKPNSIPKKDNAMDSEYSANCGLITSRLKNAKVVDSSLVESPLGIFMSNTSSGQETHRVCLKSDRDASKKLRTEREESVNSEVVKSESSTETDHSKESGQNVDAVEKKAQILNSRGNFKGTQPEVDSWLKGVEINNEDDESFVQKISEAIRDLDAALALEKTSSSEENSEKSSQRNSPGKEIKESSDPVIDFKLGSDTSSFLNFTQKSFELSSLQNTEQPQSLNFTDSFISEKKEEAFDPSSILLSSLDTKNKFKNFGFYESLKENDSLICGQSRNSSDTDDEVWRKRIEKGEISEKVKEKSKSIANLMVLTHIDSDDSDVDLDKPFDKNLNRNSFSRRSGSFAKCSSSNNFGSENDLAYAVLEEDFKESLKKLNSDHKEHGHFDSLGVILSSSVNRDNVWENFFKPEEKFENIPNVDSAAVDQVSEPDIEILKEKNTNNFLGDVASEKHSEKSESFVKEQYEMNAFINCNKKKIALENNILVDGSSNCDNVSCKFNYSESIDKSSSSQSKWSLAENSENLPQGDSIRNSQLQNESLCALSLQNRTRGASARDDEMPVVVQISGTGAEKTENSEIKSKDFQNDKIKVIPEITMTEAEEETVDTVEEVYVVGDYKCRPFKFVMKNDVDFPKVEVEIGNENSKNLHFNEKKLFTAAEGILGKFGEPCTSLVNDSGDQLNNKSGEIGSEKFLRESNGTVIIGACEAFTLDYFKGLKTTSEDMNVEEIGEEDKIVRIMEDMRSKEANLDVWDKHLEKTFTQQLNNANFDYISFRSFGPDSYEEETKSSSLNENNCKISLDIIADFIEAEKFHTEKVEESIQLNRLTSLTVMANEEDYENFKLRTPDDERSSDSGFRDKGSLSESVEDPGEGKYNLEDIEAELEEAYVKGVFGNCESEKEKEDSKNFSNFEFEEAKFYEDENKNEEDYSDIDGEIDFWQNKDDSDYYPEISEFSPTCSQGWYLHPPEENIPSFQRNVNEDLVNALRNELQESLPIQARSFDQLNDFYETEIKEAKRDLSIHYASDFGLPLSPITEEQNISEGADKNYYNSFPDGNVSNKCRKNMTSLMESAKAIDTNTFKQYLDYMIESEGKDLDGVEETEENMSENEKKMIIDTKDPSSSDSNFEEEIKRALGVDGEGRTESSLSDTNENYGALFLEDLESDSPAKKFQESNLKDDLLIVNVDTDEAKLLEEPRPKSHSAFAENQEIKHNYADTVSDCSENDGLIFTPEMLSPEKERSLSEISRSSNGTQTADALSDITMSSPDLIGDCFTSVQEILPNNEANEIIDELIDSKVIEKLRISDSSFSDQKLDSGTGENAKKCASPINETEETDMFEMSTSFMGSDDCDEEAIQEPKYILSEWKELEREQVSLKELKPEKNVSGWDSDSSVDEDLSSSSGEFIWKDGDKESKVKVAHANDCDIENSLNETSQSDSAAESVTNGFLEKCKENKITLEKEDEEDDDGCDNESSTESSASITDFVPSAWNSQATPVRSALRSSDKSKEPQKKSVWFKKQKYHCVYEYPREPSDDEGGDNSTFTIFSYEKNPSDLQNFLSYDVSSFELPNQFSLGPSKVTNYCNFVDWDLADEDKSLTEGSLRNAFEKTDLDFSNDVINFFEQNSFDYDFSSAGLPEKKNEFLVSSSSRPFHGSSSSIFLPKNDGIFEDTVSENEMKNSYDFATPDSGLDDSSHTDLDNEQGLPESGHSFDSKPDTLRILDDLKFSFPPELKEDKVNKNTCHDGFPQTLLEESPLVLGELRHARGRLKLDLPHNHNTNLSGVVTKKNEE